MLCDKCHKKFSSNWVPVEGFPRYDITENTGFGEYSSINLCMECSIRFRKWLEKKEREARVDSDN